MQQARHKKNTAALQNYWNQILRIVPGVTRYSFCTWMMRGTGAIPLPKTLRSTETAILHLLKSPLVKQQFTSSFLKETQTAFDALLRVRNEMHLQSKSLHDTLELAFSRALLHICAIGQIEKNTGRSFYAGLLYCIEDSCSLLLTDPWLGQSPLAFWSLKDKTIKVGNTFILRDGRIHCAKSSIHIDMKFFLTHSCWEANVE